MKLPEHDRLQQAYPDAMDTVKDAIEHIFNLMIGREDSDKVWATEIDLDRFGLLVEKGQEVEEGLGKHVLLSGWLLMISAMLILASVFHHLISLQAQFSPDIWVEVTWLEGGITICICHTYIPKLLWLYYIVRSLTSIVVGNQRNTEVLFKGLLGDTQRQTLFYLLDTLTALLSPKITPSMIKNLERMVPIALARLERDFPISIQVYVYYQQRKTTNITLSPYIGHNRTPATSHFGWNQNLWACSVNVDVCIWKI